MCYAVLSLSVRNGDIEALSSFRDLYPLEGTCQENNVPPTRKIAFLQV
jgi:hypothetical protein